MGHIMTKQATPDATYMERALKLARRGLGYVSPNPMVGVVIVRGGRIVGEGYHRRYGGPHAEVNAIASAQGATSGATLYVTLEPCCHYGKTPPCVAAVIKAGIKRVVIGTLDPYPQMQGKSLEILREAGIETEVGVLEAACLALNEVYFHYINTGRPFVTVKFAQTLDGRIATAAGSSRWISSPPSLKLAHRLRARHDAILVGAGTVLADDPELTTRLVRGRNPLRVVLDSRLRLSLAAKVLTRQDKARTLVAATPAADPARLAALGEMGIEVLQVVANAAGRVDLEKLLPQLAEWQVSSVLVEGGAAVITAFLRAGLADRLVVFIAPRIIGRGIEAVGELDIAEVAGAIKIDYERVYRSGEDIVVEGRVG